MYVTVQPAVTLVKGTLVGSGMLVIHVAIGLLASLASASVGWWALAGIVLYVLGSWLNTTSERQRMRWKKRPRNVGHLYTRGLFRACRHPNYFGDTIVFVGFALITGSPVALILPATMAAVYLFAAIPARERRLADNYGDEFDIWAERSRRYIPFVY
jgi:steroid 5-alpha reductase family enzyme